MNWNLLGRPFTSCSVVESRRMGKAGVLIVWKVESIFEWDTCPETQFAGFFSRAGGDECLEASLRWQSLHPRGCGRESLLEGSQLSLPERSPDAFGISAHSAPLEVSAAPRRREVLKCRLGGDAPGWWRLKRQLCADSINNTFLT